MNDGKIQVNVYIPRELKTQADMEIDNLSAVVTTLLSEYLNVSSIEQVNKEIIETETKLKMLYKRKQDMIDQGIAETRVEAVQQSAWDELMLFFKKRKHLGYNVDDHLSWIQSPKNVARCREMNMRPIEALQKLIEEVKKDDDIPEN